MALARPALIRAQDRFELLDPGYQVPWRAGYIPDIAIHFSLMCELA